MRILRFALLGLAGVLLLLAAALVYVVVFFDPNAHKAQLQQLVRTHTGRELELPGDLKLKLYPWLAIELGRATLGNAAGFGAEPMVEIEHARLGVKLWPLLHREIEVGAISLDAPTIRLAVDAAGHNNWADLSGKGAAETPATPGTAALPKISVAKLQITRGTLQYTDRSDGSVLAVRALSLETGTLTPGQPFDLQLAGTLQQSKALTVMLDLRGRATLDADHSRYQLAAPVLKLQLQGKAFPAAGLPLELHCERIDADLKAQTLALPGLDLRVAGARIRGALTGAKIIDAPSFTGPLQLADVSARTLLKNLGVTLPATRDATAFGRLGFSGTVSASTKALMLTGLKLHLDDTTATGRGGISNLATNALAFDLQLDRLNADRYLAPAAAPAPAGSKAAASAPVPLPVDLIRSLNLHGSLSAAEAVFAGIQYRNLRIGLNADGGRLRVFPSEAQMYGGQYHGDISVDASGRVPRVTFDEHVTAVDFAPLFHDMFETSHISGHGNGAIKAGATGVDTAALLRTLTGTLEFHVDNGAFEGTDLWYEIRRARALLKQQPVPARTGPERTAFTAVAATGRITNGVIASDDLVAALQYLQVKGHGTADIATGTLDFHLDATVLKMAEEGANAADMHDIVGLQVPVVVTGSFGAPKVRPDVSAMVKARVQQEIDKRKDEVKQKLQDKLQEKLKGLFGN
jgi:AsmA protein